MLVHKLCRAAAVYYCVPIFNNACTSYALTCCAAETCLQTMCVSCQGEATIPSTLQQELDTNPFLRPQDSDIRKTLKIPTDAADVDAFAAIRKAKDNF